MSNYTFSFDQKPILAKAIKEYQAHSYGDEPARILEGYITEITDADILENRFTVKIPELMDKKIRARVVIPLGDIHTNGSGKKPFAPENGLPVMVHIVGNSREGVILGASWLSGFNHGSNIVNYREFTGVGDLPYYQPVSHTLGELGVDSSIITTPYKVGSDSLIYQDQLVTTGNSVPGSIEVRSSTGVSYSVDIGANVKYTPMQITKVQGKQKDYSDLASEAIDKQFAQYKENVLAHIQREYIFSNGRVISGPAIRNVATLIKASVGTNNNSFLTVLQEIENVVQTVTRIAEIGSQFLNWISQDPASIIDQLLDTFGQFDLDFDLVNIDINLSLTSLDVNFDFRIGTGYPPLDTLVNTVLSTTVNVILDNLLKNFNIGEFLGLDLSALTGSGSVDTNKTYPQNIFTPVLRALGSTNTSSGIPDFIKGYLDDFIKLEDTYYQAPNIYFSDKTYLDSSPLTLLSRYIVTLAKSPVLYSLPIYLDKVYSFYGERDLVSAITFACDNHEDCLRCIFLYGYYTRNKNIVQKYLLDLGYTSTQVNKLMNQYKIWDTDSYSNLASLVEGGIYDPLDLELNLFKETLSSEPTKDAIDLLLAGNYLEYINRCMTIKAKIDLRVSDTIAYAKLKVLVDKAYPPLAIIGFDHE